jgi:uncharacterized protein (DUF488 family)
VNKPKIYTIGVYGWTEEDFFNKLQEKNIDLFVDIRFRRGMRGGKYPFANSKYLQDKLKEIGIEYLHLKELAPTESIRAIQKQEDKKANVLTSTREHLASAYIEMYNRQVLDKYDLSIFEELMRTHKAIVVFCVEREARACHRSIASEYLGRKFNLEVEHL